MIKSVGLNKNQYMEGFFPDYDDSYIQALDPGILLSSGSPWFALSQKNL